MSKLKDMNGKRFGRLRVIARAASDAGGRACWQCVCDCGTTKIVAGKQLLRGTSSCGCLRDEATRRRNVESAKHGMEGTPTYVSWVEMRRRCRTRHRKEWALYGGRGVTVCARWETFLNFLADMGPRPPGCSLDRINPNGNYTPRNCRWAGAAGQAAGRRTSRMLTYRGRTQTLTAWARELGIPQPTLSWRVRHGWPLAKAMRPA